jgi:hypothetical protein
MGGLRDDTSLPWRRAGLWSERDSAPGRSVAIGLSRPAPRRYAHVMDVVFQPFLPFAPWLVPHAWRMPGTMPLDPADWLQADPAFAAQMALRDRLVVTRAAEVTAALPEAATALEELFDLVLSRLPPFGHRVAPDHVTRPDGVTVPLDRARPLPTLARLVQHV